MENAPYYLFLVASLLLCINDHLVYLPCLLDFSLFFNFLGLPVPAVPAGLPTRPHKTSVKKAKELSISPDGESSSESGDDSDEDWVPGSEEVRRRNKMIKRFIPG